MTNKEIFFQIIQEGSLEKMRQFEQMNGRQETIELANSINENGETPLLLAISKGNHNMVRYLVWGMNVNIDQMGKFMWNGSEYLEGPPLFSAMLFESTAPKFREIFDTSLIQFLINAEFADFSDDDEDEMDEVEEMEGMNAGQPDELMDVENHKIPVYPVLESMKNSTSIVRSQKIQILELIGSAYIFISDSRQEFFSCGLACWAEAMRLRQSKIGEQGAEQAFPKVRNDLPKYAQTILGFKNLTEFMTLEELEKIIPNPFPNPTEKLDFDIKVQLHYQAVLISLRIVRSFQQGTSMHPFLFFIRHVVNTHLRHFPNLDTNETFLRSHGIALQTYSLGVRLLLELSKFLKSKDYKESQWPYYDWVKSILYSMQWQIFLQRMEGVGDENLAEMFNFDNVMEVLNLMYRYVDSLRQPPSDDGEEFPDYFDVVFLRVIYVIVQYSVKHLIKKMKQRRLTRRTKTLNEEESRQLTIWLHHFNRITRVHSKGNQNLLHFACCNFYQSLNPDFIAMLLDAGADPNATDEYHDTPAHYIAKRCRHLRPNCLNSIRLLVGGGAHLNRSNKNGQTALEKLRELEDYPENGGRLELEEIIDGSCMQNEMRLACLSAEVLRQNGIIYDEQKYPPLLVPFLVNHGANRRTCLSSYLRM